MHSFYSTSLGEDKIYLEMCPTGLGLELLLTLHLLHLIFEIKAEFLDTNYEETFLKIKSPSRVHPAPLGLTFMRAAQS